MEKTDLNSYKTLKVLFIIISIIVVAFTLTGYMLTSKEGGAVPLTSFESFYVYIITVSISLYMVINNKNANGMIVLTILTYLWTYYLVQQMIKYITDSQMFSNFKLIFRRNSYECIDVFETVRRFYTKDSFKGIKSLY